MNTHGLVHWEAKTGLKRLMSWCAQVRGCCRVWWLPRPAATTAWAPPGSAHTSLWDRYRTATKFPFIYSFSRNCVASVLISTFMCLFERLDIPRIGPHIWLQLNRQTDPRNIYISHRYECRNWERERYNSVMEIRRLHSFIFWEYINGNQTFILDSHRPFVCSVVHVV